MRLLRTFLRKLRIKYHLKFMAHGSGIQLPFILMIMKLKCLFRTRRCFENRLRFVTCSQASFQEQTVFLELNKSDFSSYFHRVPFCPSPLSLPFSAMLHQRFFVSRSKEQDSPWALTNKEGDDAVMQICRT